MQGPRWSIPYFVNPKLNFVIQGPEKRWGPVTGFDLLSKTGTEQDTIKSAEPARSICSPPYVLPAQAMRMRHAGQTQRRRGRR